MKGFSFMKFSKRIINKSNNKCQYKKWRGLYKGWYCGRNTQGNSIYCTHCKLVMSKSLTKDSKLSRLFDHSK